MLEEFPQVGQCQQLEVHFGLGDTEEAIERRESQLKAGGIRWVIEACGDLRDRLEGIDFMGEIEMLAEVDIEPVTERTEYFHKNVIVSKAGIVQAGDAGFKLIGLRVIDALINAYFQIKTRSIEAGEAIFIAKIKFMTFVAQLAAQLGVNRLGKGTHLLGAGPPHEGIGCFMPGIRNMVAGFEAGQFSNSSSGKS